MKKRSLILLSLSFFFLQSCDKDTPFYMGGDEWSKEPITKEMLLDFNLVEKDIFKRIGKVYNRDKNKAGSTVYLGQGKDESSYVFLTNYHVLSSKEECRQSIIALVDMNLKTKGYRCSKILEVGNYDDDTDYTIFSIEASESNRFLADYSEVEVDEAPQVGDELIIIGFGGTAISKSYDASISKDSDCLYLESNRNIMLDDNIMKNVFFTGCDSMAGDSGTGVFNRNSGKFVGLFFGSAVFDKKNRLTSKEIHKNLGSDYQKFIYISSWAIDARTINFTKFLVSY